MSNAPSASPAPSAPQRITLRSFQPTDLEALVALWNRAFADQRNFYPITAKDYQTRVLDCPAFDPAGLILAWQQTPNGSSVLIGIAHAFKPPAQTGVYAKWGAHHFLALLYVDPAHRRQGVGSRLLQAAQDWLYYCPVYVASHVQPCYGTLEGPRPPFFGSTQRQGLSAQNSQLINFLAHRGYRAIDPGDISMTLTLGTHPRPTPPDLAGLGLRLLTVNEQAPFTGREPEGREEYSLWGDNGGQPYTGLILVDGENLLQAHINWYPMHPMHHPGCAAIAGFWVAPALRGHGLGRYLLDEALYEMAQPALPPTLYDKRREHSGNYLGFQQVELHTHLIHHARATDLYQRRGFSIDAAWVNLVKT